MLAYLLDTEGFPPRWLCGTAWREEPWLGWMHIVADVATFAAYVTIPLLLFVALRRVRKAPAPRLMALFAVFILACGSVHLLEAVIFWYPVYRLAAVAKLVTAIASCLTAVALARAWPNLLLYRSPQELQEEIDRHVEQLNESNARIDLTTRRLEREKERLAMALSGGAMGTWDWNLETDEITLDAAEARLTHLEGEPLSADEGSIVDIEEFYGAVHQEDLPGLRADVQASIDTGRKFAHTFRMRNPDSGWKWISGRGHVVRADGQPARFLGVNFDVTEQKRIEAELDDARQLAEQASAAKSRFVANMSHEVRTPLTAILGCAESIVRESADPSIEKTALVIQRQGQLLLRVLNDVLDISKIEAGKLTVKREPCNLPVILEDVRSLMQPAALEAGLSFQLEIDPAAPEWIEADALRLRQILLNLVSNAIKFTEQGMVTVRVVEEPQQREPPLLRFEVIDTGRGIPPKDQKEVFKAFEQVSPSGKDAAELLAKSQGTGLGLTICQRLAQMLHGRIDLKSEVGVGSVFCLSLPAIVADPPASDAAPAAKRGEAVTTGSDGTPTGRLLVAEDTPSIQFLLRKILEPYATKLDFVSDGQAALDRFRVAKNGAEPYDLVLLDMHMPILSGYDVARELRRQGYRRSIIALTASAMSGDRERCLAAGCTEYVSKPIDWSTLCDAVVVALTKNASGRGGSATPPGTTGHDP